MGDTGPSPETPASTNAEREPLSDRLAAWEAAGLIDAATAARIGAFEAHRSSTERPPGISISEVIAYIGAVVLLVGVGFLYGTQYQTLGSVGRLGLIGLVVLAGEAAGLLVRQVGNGGAARRARAAGWTVVAIAAAFWFSEVFVDASILTQAPAYDYPGASPDTSGSNMLGAAIGFVISAFLLWRAGSALISVAAIALAYTTAGQFIVYTHTMSTANLEVSVAVPAVILVILSETITRGHERRWAREILRFAVVLPPTISALALSFNADGSYLEYLAFVLALVAFGLARARGSAGYAIAGGVSLFIVVNEVGFRHFAQSLGFPVVLIASGITLFAVAGGLVRLLPRLRRRS
ncbi:MAG TPA: DUF2157 domain-containing protein [Candidatus Angelobacter sp.]|nr:DUF2157 domain-containing protein [Candidatus Angelobacter sp.]